MPGKRLSLSLLAWACALLPFITTHATYLIAASHGHVDWCVPYWDACTSISATGRQMPEKLIFKLGMLPAALLCVFLWWRLRQRMLDPTPGLARLTTNSMFALGLLAAVFLMLYTLALGEEGDTYQRIRHIGVTLSFAFTYLAQLLATHLFRQWGKTGSSAYLLSWYRRLLGLLVVLLSIGLASVALDAWLGEAYDAIEDAFEWNMALLLNLWFAGTAHLLGRVYIQD